MRRAHAMSFGSEVLDDGQVRFRLWAPGARQVDLCLEAPADGGVVLPMRAHTEGWFVLTTDRARAGSLYRYRIDGDLHVPDPGSRYQPQDVHGPSEVIDPAAFDWRDEGWRGRPWEEVAFYELHVGSFSPEGSFAGVAARLDHLVELGVSAVELMPVADFPGARNWGYDGVLPFAPDSRYGRPEDLKALVQAAHARGLMMFLDVVYNHFGPEGNYLHRYAPAFFSDHRETPWGRPINYDGPGSLWVREFFIHNALYWLEEFHFDGLRLDAVHAIYDDLRPDIIEELAAAVQSRLGHGRAVHLVLENDRNQTRYLARTPDRRPRCCSAQWNDDLHHALHVLATGEKTGYYVDYADDPLHRLGRALAEGFAYQGDSSMFRHGATRGEPSGSLPPAAFVGFLQNHDQIGNRPRGERLQRLMPAEAARALTVVLLLAPAPPLLFMGQEWGCAQPFLFFCDFGPELAAGVTAGRRREFASFPEFADPAAGADIADPQAPATFAASRLDWEAVAMPAGQGWLGLHRALLALRRDEVVPRLKGMGGDSADFLRLGTTALRVRWRLGDGARLVLFANLGTEPAPIDVLLAGRCLLLSPISSEDLLVRGLLAAWTVAWFIEEPRSR
jgi:malto-oligosyltrehalose trehalohydrolase